MSLKETEALRLLPALAKLVVKLIRLSKGGITPEERKELALDLLDLGSKLLDETLD